MTCAARQFYFGRLRSGAFNERHLPRIRYIYDVPAAGETRGLPLGPCTMPPWWGVRFGRKAIRHYRRARAREAEAVR